MTVNKILWSLKSCNCLDMKYISYNVCQKRVIQAPNLCPETKLSIWQKGTWEWVRACAWEWAQVYAQLASSQLSSKWNKTGSILEVWFHSRSLEITNFLVMHFSSAAGAESAVQSHSRRFDSCFLTGSHGYPLANRNYKKLVLVATSCGRGHDGSPGVKVLLWMPLLLYLHT